MMAGSVPYSAPIDFTGRIDRHFEGNKDFTVTPDCFHAFATAGRGTEESREVLRDTIAFFEKYKTQD